MIQFEQNVKIESKSPQGGLIKVGDDTSKGKKQKLNGKFYEENKKLVKWWN